VGSVSPLAMAGYLLGKALWAPASCLITYNGGLIDVPVRPMMILPAEAVDFTLAPVHAGGDDTYLHYYQRGWITHEVVGAAQIDATGATNNVLVRRRDGSAVRLPGQGGMADVANMHRDFFVYVPRHEPRALVETVEFLSASRALTDPSERRAAGYLPGTVRVLTSLGVFEHDPGRARLVLKAVHPGSSVQEVRAHTGFAVEVSDDFEVTAPPSPLELSTLRSRVDPLAIRRLEFVPSAERAALIEELFAAEEGLIRQAAAAPLGARVGVAHGHG
jgi:glutaconate CoA-transferase subunit A